MRPTLRLRAGESTPTDSGRPQMKPRCPKPHQPCLIPMNQPAAQPLGLLASALQAASAWQRTTHCPPVYHYYMHLHSCVVSEETSWTGRALRHGSRSRSARPTPRSTSCGRAVAAILWSSMPARITFCKGSFVRGEGRGQGSQRDSALVSRSRSPPSRPRHPTQRASPPLWALRAWRWAS